MFKKISIFLLVGFLITTGLGCKGISKAELDAIKPISLNYWRVFDDNDSLGEAISAYRAIHPNITINLKKLNAEDFQAELLNALAEDRGPDIFSIQDTSLRTYLSKIEPLPSSIKAAFQRVEGTFQKKTVVDIKTVITPVAKTIRTKYIAAAADTIIIPGRDEKTGQYKEMIYGLPLSVDTLVLYYNKNMLDQAGIPEPPKTWVEFQKDVIKLAKIDQDNKVLRAGAAIGAGINISRSTDILSLIMMQNGVAMTDEAGNPTFASTPQGFVGVAPPAEQALQFYTDFAQPTKEVYTWNDKMPNSLDAFTRGQAAFFLGFGYNLPIIRARAPKLIFAIASAPQINLEAPINYASFWVETVSKKTKYSNEAWDFLLFAADAKNVVKYLDKASKTTALRELVADEKENPDLTVFANQLLTAKNWYRGKDWTKTDAAFVKMIDGVFVKETINDGDIYRKAINTAAAEVGQTMY